MHLDCPLCERQMPHETIATRDRRGKPLHTVLCMGCGVARTQPIPTPQELADFYTRQYRLAYKSVSEPQAFHVLRAGRLALTRLAMLRDAIRHTGAKVLDCGCGGGEFLYLARRLGCVPKGIEPNRGYAEYARRELDLDIESGMLEDLQVPTGGFDLITLFHVLEHVADPTAYLRRAASALATRDSILAVEVPNLTARGSHPLSRYHRAHLFHFTESTLRAAGEKAGLHAARSGHTENGGNVWAHFRAGDGPVVAPAPPDETLRILRAESALGYYGSPATWMRTLSRVARQAGERWAARGWHSRREILDSLPL